MYRITYAWLKIATRTGINSYLRISSICVREREFLCRQVLSNVFNENVPVSFCRRRIALSIVVRRKVIEAAVATAAASVVVVVVVPEISVSRRYSKPMLRTETALHG